MGERRNARAVTVRFSLLLLFSVVLSPLSAWGQAPEQTDAPQKPLRQRLLDKALKGEAEAQFNLAKNYEGGRIGLPQDLTQARRWYQAAADQGEPFAQASLGIFYNFGKGGPRDYVQAYMWFERSASHLTGAERDTVTEMRDSVGRKLSTSQIEKARQMAKATEPAVKP